MAVIRTLRRTPTLLHQSRTLIELLQSPNHSTPSSILAHLNRTSEDNQTQSRRNYVSEMRRSAVESNVLRLLRNEIQYERDCFSLELPVAEINGFSVDRRPGEQWIRLEKKFREKEEIKVEVTMFDGSAPAAQSHDGKGGQVVEEVMMHITLIVSIFKEGLDDVVEFVCSAWPDALDIDKVYVRARRVVPCKLYMGPLFKELDEKLQDSLFDFLEARGDRDRICKG
ncbi:hypothetical protein Droror1_Dr00013599 [Drosera rotundifolia]